MKDIQLTIKKANERMKTVKNTVVVMSGKGGVGKTTVAVNLAVALALEGKKVGIIDIDLHGPDVVRMLGGRDVYPTKVGDELVPPEVNGVKVISISHFLKEETNPIVWRGPLKTGTILEFFSEVAWEDLDFLIVDCPPGTGDEPLTVFQNIQNILGAVIVTTPSVVSQDDVEKAINFVKLMNQKTLGLVENMSYYKCSDCGSKHYIFGKDGAKKLSEKYDLELLQEIPINEIIRENSDKGMSSAYFGNNEIVSPFVLLGKKIINKSVD
jgi:ATP-binding protein involved in chromosome partitioning